MWWWSEGTVLDPIQCPGTVQYDRWMIEMISHRLVQSQSYRTRSGAPELVHERRWHLHFLLFVCRYVIICIYIYICVYLYLYIYTLTKLYKTKRVHSWWWRRLFFHHHPPLESSRVTADVANRQANKDTKQLSLPLPSMLSLCRMYGTPPFFVYKTKCLFCDVCGLCRVVSCRVVLCCVVLCCVVSCRVMFCLWYIQFILFTIVKKKICPVHTYGTWTSTMAIYSQIVRSTLSVYIGIWYKYFLWIVGFWF